MTVSAAVGGAPGTPGTIATLPRPRMGPHPPRDDQRLRSKRSCLEGLSIGGPLLLTILRKNAQGIVREAFDGFDFTRHRRLQRRPGPWPVCSAMRASSATAGKIKGHIPTNARRALELVEGLTGSLAAVPLGSGSRLVGSPIYGRRARPFPLSSSTPHVQGPEVRPSRHGLDVSLARPRPMP